MPFGLLNKTNDRVFKEMFMQNKSSMADFLKCILNIPNEEFEDLEFVDIHNSDIVGECVMDINFKTKNHIIDVEVQIKRSPVIEQKILFYLANMIRNQELKSYSYHHMKKSVSIVISEGYNVNNSEGYINKYQFINKRDGSLFSNLVEIIVIELPKLPNESDGTPLWDWLRFLKSKDRACILSLANNNKEIKKAYDTLISISGDEVEQHIAQQHEFYLADQFELRVEAGIKKEKDEIARNAIKMGLDISNISKLTGLSVEEIEKLKHE